MSQIGKSVQSIRQDVRSARVRSRRAQHLSGSGAATALFVACLGLIARLQAAPSPASLGSARAAPLDPCPILVCDYAAISGTSTKLVKNGMSSSSLAILLVFFPEW